MRETLDTVVAGIRQYAADNELLVTDVSRDEFLSNTEFTRTDIDRHGTWSWVKGVASSAPDSATVCPYPAVPGGHHVKGVSTLVSKDGETVAQWIKTTHQYDREGVLKSLLEDLPKDITKRSTAVKYKSGESSSELLAVYPMGDPHIGMLSWAPETGEDFDLPLAKSVMCSAMDALVTRGPRADKALVLNLGDFFHSDNSHNKTARSGHPLDVDGRWPKVLQTGIEIMVYMIDRALEEHKEVHVINEIGNHDDHSAMFLSVALNAYYTKESRVHIDISPSCYHWFRFGKNLLGITHGHNQKMGDLESIMAAEKPKDWGDTEHRYWYCGHLHHIIKKELRGCVIEVFRTLAARDAYAANAGYKSGRDMNRIILHKEYGEIGRDVVNASYLKSVYDKERK